MGLRAESFSCGVERAEPEAPSISGGCVIVFRSMAKTPDTPAPIKNVSEPKSARARSSQTPKNANLGRRNGDPVRVRAILERLNEAYPAASCALKHENAFQLLISTILSAQCTDERVNIVTATLFPT
jgi:hypothetical protein